MITLNNQEVDLLDSVFSGKPLENGEEMVAWQMLLNKIANDTLTRRNMHASIEGQRQLAKQINGGTVSVQSPPKEPRRSHLQIVE